MSGNTVKSDSLSKRLNDFATRSAWVLDVDDAMYSIECGLHDYIKENITRVYNDVAVTDPNKDQIVSHLQKVLKAQGHKVEDPSCIKPEELGVAFPAIVQTLNDIYPDTLFTYLNDFYGDQYDRIKQDSNLVKAFQTAHDKGIKIYFYTNGPSSPVKGEISHLQKVMKQRGFDDKMIEYMRSRTYDLLMSVQAGRGKPSAEGMQDFLKFSGINPKEALMADDGPKNLVPAAELGMLTLWTWTTSKAPKANDVKIAEDIGSIRVRDTGKALLQIAQTYKPALAKRKTPKPAAQGPSFGKK